MSTLFPLRTTNIWSCESKTQSPTTAECMHPLISQLVPCHHDQQVEHLHTTPHTPMYTCEPRRVYVHHASPTLSRHTRALVIIRQRFETRHCGFTITTREIPPAGRERNMRRHINTRDMRMPSGQWLVAYLCDPCVCFICASRACVCAMCRVSCVVSGVVCVTVSLLVSYHCAPHPS